VHCRCALRVVVLDPANLLKTRSRHLGTRAGDNEIRQLGKKRSCGQTKRKNLTSIDYNVVNRYSRTLAYHTQL